MIIRVLKILLICGKAIILTCLIVSKTLDKLMMCLVVQYSHEVFVHRKEVQDAISNLDLNKSCGKDVFKLNT